ncbi:zinc-dependent peptidase [Flavihumibacter sp.]|uniref:zinc-dependent peptidase n=1 Tax=Flavihumibacter sp. TaxID=1913981 RepID=UPI002FCA44F3
MEIVLICLLVFCTIFLFEVLHVRLQKFLLYRRRRGFEQHEPFFRKLISANIRYFNKVDEETRHKWLFRTYLFYRSKKFHYVGVQKSDEMPILISATAAQLTLGLENFSLNYFHDIYVLQHDYHYGYYSLPFMGHVDSSGIYLSWDNFLTGIRSAHDSSNVGLHEMAHALAYVNFITKTDEDKHFKKEFHQFSKVARPVYQEMQRGRRTILGEYAATNYHEFWAVSVEVFFENPIRFRHELPELYDAMTRLLKQDPYAVLLARLAA